MREEHSFNESTLLSFFLFYTMLYHIFFSARMHLCQVQQSAETRWRNSSSGVRQRINEEEEEEEEEEEKEEEEEEEE